MSGYMSNHYGPDKQRTRQLWDVLYSRVLPVHVYINETRLRGTARLLAGECHNSNCITNLTVPKLNQFIWISP